MDGVFGAGGRKRKQFHFQFDKRTPTSVFEAGSLSNVNKNYYHGKIAAWNDFENHPSRDGYWLAQATESWLHGTTVRCRCRGWWDQKTSTVRCEPTIFWKKADQIAELPCGCPWNHGDGSGKRHASGRVSFGSATMSISAPR